MRINSLRLVVCLILLLVVSVPLAWADEPAGVVKSVNGSSKGYTAADVLAFERDVIAWKAQVHRGRSAVAANDHIAGSYGGSFIGATGVGSYGGSFYGPGRGSYRVGKL